MVVCQSGERVSDADEVGGRNLVGGQDRQHPNKLQKHLDVAYEFGQWILRHIGKPIGDLQPHSFRHFRREQRLHFLGRRWRNDMRRWRGGVLRRDR